MRLRLSLVLSVVLSSCATAAGAPTSPPPLALTPGLQRLNYEGREVVVYWPKAKAPRGLVVVLHGGLGNANRIIELHNEKGLNLNTVAEKDGFAVAYVNGTKVARLFSDDKRGWNAGTCCGLPAQNNVDDVGYLTGFVRFLTSNTGLDPSRVFAMGHSNGAMMALRMVCETDVFAAAVPISGALGIEPSRCTHARGKRVWALIGALDDNVPVAGGRGRGLSRAVFTSQEATKDALVNAGADYHLQIVEGAMHQLDTVEAVIEKTEQVSLGEKAAAFFELSGP